MRLPSTVIALGLACVVGGCGAASQSQAKVQVAGSQCSALAGVERHVAELYAVGGVERVEPLERQVLIARAIQPRYVVGARLYVPAQQGTSQAYLQRVLSCHASSGANVHPNDPLHASNLRNIDVKTQGQRYVVSIEGADRAAGREIWQRARALRDSAAQVGVRQLSALPSHAPKL